MRGVALYGSPPVFRSREETHIPANANSYRITNVYRERLVALRNRAVGRADEQWRTVDLADLDGTFADWASSTARSVAETQRLGVRLSAAFLAAFLASELGHRVRTPDLDYTRYVGRSRDGRASLDALDTARIGVLAALKDGADNTKALEAGRQRALRAVELDAMHAARTATLEGIKGDDRFAGWQRVTRGTCGACMALSGIGGPQFSVHPGCACVAQPRVSGVRDRFPVPSGAALFATKSREEQDAALGPEVAERIRSGEATLDDLVDRSHLDSDADDFLTQGTLG